MLAGDLVYESRNKYPVNKPSSKFPFLALADWVRRTKLSPGWSGSRPGTRA